MRFENLNREATPKTFKEVRQWRRERAGKMKLKDYSYAVPTADPDLIYLHSNSAEPSLTWIGHSTFLIQHSGLNIITDPIWAEKLALQRRLSPPGLAIQDVPPIDVVLISHSHYDHLHMKSLEQLKGSKMMIVPVGLAAKLRRKGFSSIIELEWWQSATISGITFTFVPAQHWTRRTLTDTNTSHWGGFIIESELAPTVYFAGDSGYFDGFKEIGSRFDIDVALMPIGAYEPEWFMRQQHVTPEEALQAFLDVGAKRFIPMHYGSYKLADDTPREALDRLEAESKRLSLARGTVMILPHGETVRLNDNK
ncbi:MBL fold metallo-hydrolase [Paenibacillus sp. BC26]|uniref:MBL fold metallo-hydrolase n=1 Tax=Paenibacillus sp. BC26 TaxID=1881032 RepID=UPI0008EAAF7C|nr:MBL fold metallo-hydrolase [Paenibacillus sp. BC26]SFT03397.1 L-ascorbate metabolism protein UlaG, beta-lactamase superfamily [Paenibacillus sp. BC26]